MTRESGPDFRPEQCVSVHQAAALLQIGAERVRQLQRAGYIPRTGRGKTTVGGAVQGYASFLKDAARKAFTRGIARGRAHREECILLDLGEALDALMPVEPR